MPTFPCRAKYDHWFIPHMPLKDWEQFRVETMSELKVILLFALETIDVARESARAIFLAKLQYRVKFS